MQHPEQHNPRMKPVTIGIPWSEFERLQQLAAERTPSPDTGYRTPTYADVVREAIDEKLAKDGKASKRRATRKTAKRKAAKRKAKKGARRGKRG